MAGRSTAVRVAAARRPVAETSKVVDDDIIYRAPTAGRREGGAVGEVVALGIVVHVRRRLSTRRARPMRTLTGTTVVPLEPAPTARHRVDPRPNPPAHSGAA